MSALRPVLILFALAILAMGGYWLWSQKALSPRGAAQETLELIDNAAKDDLARLERILGQTVAPEAPVTLEFTMKTPGGPPRIFNRQQFTGAQAFASFVSGMLTAFTPGERVLSSTLVTLEEKNGEYTAHTTHRGEGGGKATAFGSDLLMAFAMEGACTGPVRFTQAGKRLVPQWQALHCTLEIRSKPARKQP